MLWYETHGAWIGTIATRSEVRLIIKKQKKIKGQKAPPHSNLKTNPVMMFMWQRWLYHLTWLWCSMPMLMVLMRIAIIMPLLKYLLSTMPQSFLLIPFQMSIQCRKQDLFFFSPSTFSSRWFSSLPVSFTASSSSSSPLAKSPAALAPSFSDNAHMGQSSGFWGTVRLMELASGWVLWSGLFWCGQWDATGMQKRDQEEYETLAVSIELSSDFEALRGEIEKKDNANEMPVQCMLCMAARQDHLFANRQWISKKKQIQLP